MSVDKLFNGINNLMEDIAHNTSIDDSYSYKIYGHMSHAVSGPPGVSNRIMKKRYIGEKLILEAEGEIHIDAVRDEM